MPYSEYDAWEEDWAYDQYLQHSRQAIAEFTSDRLGSYYVRNPKCAQPARSFVADADELLPSQSTAAFLLAAIAIEVAIKGVYLKPIIAGLVHSELAAELIAEMAVRVSRFDLLESPFLQLIKDHGQIDFSTYRRTDRSELLWTEIKQVQKKRDQIAHRAQRASEREAVIAVEISKELLDTILPTLAKTLGLHVHDTHLICREPFCSDTPGIRLWPL